MNRRRNDCLVLIHGPIESALANRYVLPEGVVYIGRDRDNDIVLHSDSVASRHAKVEEREGHFYITDLGSANGTLVNNEPEPVASSRLRPGDTIRIGDTVFKYLSGSDVEREFHHTIFQMTITDGLTGVSNKKYLDKALSRAVARTVRHEWQLSVAIIDVDHFKVVNDTRGRLAGDSVLRGLAAILQQGLRPDDELGRYGGDEFCAILLDTSLEAAARVGEKLRVRVGERAFIIAGEEISVTISIGIAEMTKGMDMQDLYKSAEKMLCEAKRAGRNRVAC